MDLKTAIAVLIQQGNDLNTMINNLLNNAYNAQSLINQENNGIPAINPQIKSLAATMSIIMTSINSQDVLAQGTIDTIAQLANQ